MNKYDSIYINLKTQRNNQPLKPMATLTIRLPDDKHTRLKELAKTRGISVNKLIEDLSTLALAEFDAQTRFKAIAASGDPSEGLRLLAKLDTLLSPQNESE